jgi:polyphosphate kinase 2 (PPK2 family)
MLESLDLTRTLDRDAYDARLKELQLKLVRQQRKFVERGIAAVIVFEGMDAAGKGGAIKRMTAKLDPRGYEVHPIGPPDATELNHVYLWRFWNAMPGAGRIAIFDRSWYGRVLVERVEKLATKEQWSRAYDEISEFEHTLVKEGMVVLKFWLHITREDDPYKRWKITKEDWRNRDNWEHYVAAGEEMFAKTSTAWAPWTVVPADDKLYARIAVVEAVADAFDHAIADKNYGLPQQAPKLESPDAMNRPASGARSILEAGG